jgi:PilZ domain
MHFNCRTLCPRVRMLDQRRSPRFDALRGATVETPVGALTCVIRNISQTGACLESARPASIPDTFFLTIWPSLNCRCEVVWRREHRLGIRFKTEKTAAMITALAATPTVPSAGDPDARAKRKDATSTSTRPLASRASSARVVIAPAKATLQNSAHKTPNGQMQDVSQQGSSLLSRRPSSGSSRASNLSYMRKDH